MAKRKMVQHNLVKNSVAAYFAAIEIHNKPNITYRYETVTLLLMNAWELALKAYIRKYLHTERSIFEKNGHTISFDRALDYVSEHINAKKPKSFQAIKENLLAIEGYRNNVAHFYCDDLLPCILALVSRCALNFVEFLQTHFKRDIMAEQDLFVMPLGFKQPLNPKEFLSKSSPAYTSSSEAKRFIDQIVKTISSLKDAGIEDSIVLWFDVYLQTVRKPDNSDILLKTSPSYYDILPLNDESLERMTYDEFVSSTSDPGDLSLVFHAAYERSGDGSVGLQERVDAANRWYDFLIDLIG